MLIESTAHYQILTPEPPHVLQSSIELRPMYVPLPLQSGQGSVGMCNSMRVRVLTSSAKGGSMLCAGRTRELQPGIPRFCLVVHNRRTIQDPRPESKSLQSGILQLEAAISIVTCICDVRPAFPVERTTKSAESLSGLADEIGTS
ncbi:MAG: hypothetical protein JWN70_2226 [Planctomycetaceae bacterium]|nr:hypothetical protein [Planctomycetaceae bacterium]